MESFLIKALNKAKREAPRRCKELRDYCDQTLPQLGDREKDEDEDDADKYFYPFKLCCDSQYPRLMEIGLDTIHCLIEYGYLKGNTVLEPIKDGNNDNNKRILMDLIIETVSKCSDIPDDGVQLQVIKALLIAVTSVYCEVHESSLLLAVRACFHIHLVTKNQVNKTTARAALTQMLSVVQQRMENYEIKMSAKDENCAELNTIIPENVGDSDVLTEGDGTDSNDKSSDKDMTFASVYHKDTFLLFRALCKLSMKGLHDDSGSQSDPIALQNKLLSLELILHMLNHSGSAFRSGERFVYAIRNYLCVSLLGNCTSQVTQITTLSLQIFVALMDGFKKHLKNELEVFVTNIFLRILESENSTFDHKLRVLEVFYNICSEPSSLIEIFINYDCDFESIDLFRRIVDGFSKIAKNPSLAASKSQLDFMTSNGKRALLEEQTIRMKGLEGLTTILKSLIKAGSFQQSNDDASVTRGHRSSTITLISPLKNGSNDDDSNELDNIAIDAVAPSSANDDDDNKVTKIVEVFDRKQKIQEEIENGILKFNISSKKGLAYLSSLGHVEMTPKSVANFLHQYQDRLDKTAVGEYLGREREYENGFCLKVLYEYVDSMDFNGMLFDLAIRHFLAGFRLPGESQKIDRLMEKFAERYYLQNRDTFASADMAFILAFSTIMLQTNLHNPAIREDKRMTKEQFIKQNKGISSDGELSDELLSDVYDRIAAEPISITQDDKLLRKLKKDEQQAFLVFQTSTDKKRKDAFNNERKEMVKASEAMFKLKQRRDSSMRTSAPGSHEAYIRPMFDIVWAPITGVFSQIFETYDDIEMISLALEGFQAAVQLACRLDFPTARHTYINALTKFTTLDTIKEMQPKNIECIKIILDIALSDGEYLDESWSQVLHCISQVSRLQLFASGFHTDDLFFSNESNRNISNSNESSVLSMKRRSSVNTSKKDNNVLDPFTKLFSGPSKAETFRLIEESNAELLAKNINGSLIDRVFVNSENLSPESVCHFVKCLCEVSMVEITGAGREALSKGDDSLNNRPSTPRIFSLQKLVEVADFNMYSRSRIAWNHIWGLLNFHFTAVGVNDNHALAMYAIDSLKQLSIKFLQKDELSNFNFQRVFLKPFEIIISKSKSPQIRDLVLRCIDIMIKACASNIRSGWRTIFAIFEVAATQEVQEIASIAFEIIERLLETQFDLLIYDFVELMNCLVAFAAGGHSTLSLKALDHLAICADKLASGAVNSALPVVTGAPTSPLPTKNTDVTNNQSTSGSVAAEASNEISQDASVFRIWWPLLLGLSTRVGDVRLQVRFKALETLTFVLRKYGNLFSPQTWAMIFKGVLFPIVDSAKTDFTQQPESSFPTENPKASTNKQSWIGTMGQPVLSVCIDLYQLYKEKSEAVNLLPDMFTMLGSCICQDTESLARMGLASLSKLILSYKEGNNENHKPIVMPVAMSELICMRLASFLLQNICMDFEDVGQIELIDGTPANIRSVLADCPLNRRRKNKLDDVDSTRDSVSSTAASKRASGSAINIGAAVKTMYGEGKLVAVAAGKRTIQLPWGLLYSFDSTTSIIPNPSTPARSDSLGGMSMTPRLTSEQAWRQFTKSAMTSMVISLDFIEVISNIVSFHCASFSSKHVTTLLDSLEAFYWHARSFNDNYRLRYKLRQKGFMIFLGNNNMLPHLIEQEVNSISRIIDLLLKIYLRDNGYEYNDTILAVTADRLDTPLQEFDLYIEENMRRLSMIILNRYIDLDKISPSSMSDRFFIDQLEAYVPAVNIVLHGIFCFNPVQFQRNCTTILPLLSKLIICSDRNIRLFIKNIFEKQIHPIVFSGGNNARK